MAGLATQGFNLSYIPPLPEIPQNIGKIDVAGMYDTAIKALQAQDLAHLNSQKLAADSAQLGTQRAQALATQQALPSQTQAEINKSNVLASANSPEVARLTGDVDAGKLKTLFADTEFQNSLSPQQRAIFAAKGVPTSTTSTVQRNPDNTTTSSTVSGAVLPGAAPIATNADTVTTPTTPVVTTIPGVNGGVSPGAVISNVGLGGKSQTEVLHAPIGALNNIVSASERRVVGIDRDEQGNALEVVQNYQRSPTGEFHPVGAPTKITAGSDPTVIRPAGSSPIQAQPFISKDAAKAIEDAQGEVQVLQQRKLELQNINNAAEQYIGSNVGAGKFTGPIRSFLGDAKAQEFTGSVQNALQTALQPLRGTGRVSQTEFNQALSALPTINDQAETIRAKLGYLNYVTDWAQARQQSYLENLGKGLNRYQAFQAAQKSTPLPEAPNFAAGETGTYAPPVQAPPAPQAATTPVANPAADILAKYGIK